MSDREMVARQFIELIPLLMRNMGSHMRCHGAGLVPAHFRMLGMLAKRSYNLSELAETQSVTPATMSNSVAILVERGLVERTPVANDRRVVQVCLTQSGREILAQVHRSLEVQVGKHFENISDDELATVGAGLRILNRVLSNSEAQPTPCDTIQT